MATQPRGEAQTYLLIPPSRRLLAGVVLALSNFMVVLDLTIAAPRRSAARASAARSSTRSSPTRRCAACRMSA